VSLPLLLASVEGIRTVTFCCLFQPKSCFNKSLFFSTTCTEGPSLAFRRLSKIRLFVLVRSLGALEMQGPESFFPVSLSKDWKSSLLLWLGWMEAFLTADEVGDVSLFPFLFCGSERVHFSPAPKALLLPHTRFPAADTRFLEAPLFPPFSHTVHLKTCRSTSRRRGLTAMHGLVHFT